MNQELTKKWSELRGLEVVSIALNPITLPDEDAAMIKQAQRDSHQPQSQHGRRHTCRRSGRGHAFRRRERWRCHERLYRHGNGFKCRRSKRPVPFCHGTAAGSAARSGSRHPPKTHGNVPAELSHRATSAPNAEQNAPTTAGNAPADRSTRVNSAQTAAPKSPRASLSINATNAAGSPRTRKIRPNSAPSAETPLTTKTFVRRSADGNNTRI